MKWDRVENKNQWACLKKLLEAIPQALPFYPALLKTLMIHVNFMPQEDRKVLEKQLQTYEVNPLPDKNIETMEKLSTEKGGLLEKTGPVKLETGSQTPPKPESSGDYTPTTHEEKGSETLREGYTNPKILDLDQDPRTRIQEPRSKNQDPGPKEYSVTPEVRPCDLKSTKVLLPPPKIPKAVPRKSSVSPGDVEFVFAHWQAVMNHPQAKLDAKRKRVIKQALKAGYSDVQLCDAISGCAKTPFNMGENERGQRYDRLQLILRDADQIDRFIHNHANPPRARIVDPIRQNNLSVLEKMLAADEATATDPEHLRNIDRVKTWVQERKDQ